ncbi:hypothetical protein Ahy_B08g093186 [Arachis hypogaea]|uniref:Uncharacterized protein n=1 Tax=Arachis hypogaea TaxID=3818 RepID=A0A444Y5D4_ARAHY|nr:hypothetical protein Ahy_B08g093186 [Arachis hypogaea]
MSGGGLATNKEMQQTQTPPVTAVVLPSVFIDAVFPSTVVSFRSSIAEAPTSALLLTLLSSQNRHRSRPYSSSVAVVRGFGAALGRNRQLSSAITVSSKCTKCRSRCSSPVCSGMRGNFDCSSGIEF